MRIRTGVHTCALPIFDVATSVYGGIEIAEQHIGVGHGRLQSAAVITGRTRIGPGADRADLHGLEHAIVAADGSAAGTERHQMHHRNRHHPAFDDRVEVIVLDATFDDDADVETGAAHVGR